MIVRTKANPILLGLLLVLLPVLLVLAVLQYQWIGEVSAAARDRLASSLRVASNRFATDFDAELSRLANAFQMRDGFPDSVASITNRYRAWSETDQYGRLVRAIYLARTTADNGAELYRVDLKNQELEPATLPIDLGNIRDRFRPGLLSDAAGDTMLLVTMIFRTGLQAFAPGTEDLRERLVDEFRWRRGESGRALRSTRRESQDRGRGPEPRQGPGPGAGIPIEGATIIELDRDVILKDLIPTLAERHFSSHDQTAYRIAIVTGGAEPRVLYSSAGEWKPEDIARPDEALNLFGGPRPPGATGRGRGPGPRALLQGSLISEPWQLVVKHRAGSLEKAVEEVRIRNLAVSFGILLVMGAGLITLVISSYRAHTLGKLQMEFAAGVSHELRTPLAVIRSAAHNLRSGIVRDREGVEEYAKIVQEEARRLSDMVEEVLLYSETESGRKKYKLEHIDVNEVIDRALTNILPAISLEQCELSTHIDPELPPVKADAAALTQCVQNLVSNAFKYGRNGEKAQIEIVAGKDPEADEIRLSVTDHGPGIEYGDQRQLFEAFYRGANVESNVPGNGLGLHLVKSIMQAQGGRVTFNPAPHGGASFTLHIPAAS